VSLAPPQSAADIACRICRVCTTLARSQNLAGRRSRERPCMSEAKASSRNVLAEPSTASRERCEGVKRNAPIPLTHLVSFVLCQHRVDSLHAHRTARRARGASALPVLARPAGNQTAGKPDKACDFDGRRHTGREGPAPHLACSVSSVACRHRVARRQFDRPSSLTADKVGACGARPTFGLIGGD
jgi:hypothetical protein